MHSLLLRVEAKDTAHIRKAGKHTAVMPSFLNKDRPPVTMQDKTMLDAN